MASGNSAGSKQNTASGKEHQANGLGEELESVAAEASESVQEAAGELTQTLRQQVTSQITAQQERAVDTLDTVALLLQQAGEHASKEEKVTIAQYTDQASEQVERLSNAIRDRQADQLLNETRQLAQKQPGWFVGGALLAGFLGARFLRSSAQTQQTGSTSQASDDGASRGDRGGDAGSGTSDTSASASAETDGSSGRGAMTGVIDTSARGTTYHVEEVSVEEEVSILEELAREETLRKEEKADSSSASPTADDLPASEMP